MAEDYNVVFPPGSAWCDSVAFESHHGWGLRTNEMRQLQTVDFSRNSRVPYMRNYGADRIRWGKPRRSSRSAKPVWSIGLRRVLLADSRRRRR